MQFFNSKDLYLFWANLVREQILQCFYANYDWWEISHIWNQIHNGLRSFLQKVCLQTAFTMSTSKMSWGKIHLDQKSLWINIMPLEENFDWLKKKKSTSTSGSDSLEGMGRRLYYKNVNNQSYIKQIWYAFSRIYWYIIFQSCILCPGKW